MPFLRRFLPVTVIAVLVAGLGLPAGALSYESGKVTWISDGDTYTVDPTPGSEYRVRMTGINAPETGACWAAGAESRLGYMINGKTVTLSYSKDTMSGDRHWRWTSVSGYGDVGLKLLQEGRVLPFPHQTETSKNLSYMKAATTAAAQKLRVWDSDACDSGPDQDNTIKLFVNWDADGTDGDNPNGEYVRLRNYGSDSVSLSGWWVRDSGTDHYYHFPSGASIPADGNIRIYMGSGSNSSSRYYTGWDRSIFLNIDRNGGPTLGDGAYLFDPDGDLRASMMYPCVLSCSDSLRGDVSISVRYNPDGTDTPNGEYVKVRNISSHRVYLTNYVLESYPYVYDFYVRGVSSRLEPGEYVKVRIGKGDQTRRSRYWGKSKPILNNTGDYVRLRTHDDIAITCKDWGSGDC